ncbi:MAG: nucleotide exchange factor GrpE [Nanoarchaeota archaeon]|nr:nucleotide exchange factor GrpE [Nanoarchaeota archaeon]
MTEEKKQNTTSKNEENQAGYKNESETEASGKTISEKVKNAAAKVKDSIKKEKTAEEKIEELEEQLREAQGDFLRARADLENYKRRTQEELVLARDRAITSFVQDLLPSIDNFEMSLKMTDNKEMFIKGVEMIHGNLISTLKEHKIENFEPKVGDEYNPQEHEPMLIEDESAEEGKVLAVIQKGFKKGETIIRPAKVQMKKPREE